MRETLSLNKTTGRAWNTAQLMEPMPSHKAEAETLGAAPGYRVQWAILYLAKLSAHTILGPT